MRRGVSLPWWYTQGVYIGWCTRVGIPRVYIGCIYQVVGILGCTWGVYTRWWVSRVHRVVYTWYICLPTMVRWYSSLVYTPPCHPGYTTVYTVHTVYHDQGVRCAPLRREGALGSSPGLIREMRRIEPLRTLKVLHLLGNSAQSYSCSPRINVTKIG